MVKLFVYGTLLTGEGNWSWALNPQVGIPDRLKGAKLYNLGSFPGIKLSDNPDDEVIGEMFEIPLEKLSTIDRLEGYNPHKESTSMYSRIEVVLSSGETAYTYRYNGSTTEESRIQFGDWRKRRQL